MLLDQRGDLLWYQQLGLYSLDFKLLPDGRMTYNDNRYWHLLDSNFAEVDSVVCRNGYKNDAHDMAMSADGHYFLVCIEDTFINLSSLLTVTGSPGALNARLDAVVIQELDGAKNVVQEWHGLDHYQITDPDSSYFTNPSVFELNHTNSIDLDGHGKVLLSHRALNEITQVDWATGQIDWQLSGKHNQFASLDAVTMIGQHDARYLPNGRISAFDNGNLSKPARGVVLALDTVGMQATLEWEYAHASSDAMGSMRRMADGSSLLGFGRIFPTNEPVVSYLAADSSHLFDIRFLDSCSTYRAVCTDLPWDLHRPRLNCQVQSGQVLLGVDGVHGQYEWTNGQNSATIVVADTGWYQAFVPRGVGMMSTPEVHITDMGNACLALAADPSQSRPPRIVSQGIYDLLGRPVTIPQKGQVYLERYSDGSSRKRIWW